MASIQSTYGLSSLFGTQNGLLNGSSPFAMSTRKSPDATEDTSATFAADIISRISHTSAGNSSTDTIPADSTTENAEAPKSTTDLEASLQRAAAHVADKYGKEAATAVMGMVYKGIGSGEVTEESLGAGLLDAVRFIDSNFGMAEGDDFMAFLNDDLNAEMNDYFDNGLTERFFASAPGTESIAQSVSSALSMVTDTSGKDTADGILALLEAAMASADDDMTADPMLALKNALAEADATLTAQGQTSFTALLAQNSAQATASMQPGSLLDIAV